MLNKTPININFSQGIDTKADPFQLPIGQFQNLQNSVFDKAQRLSKRNGFGALTTLPNNTSLFLSTFNGNLTAIGTNLETYSSSTNTWVSKGSLQLASLDTLPLVRSALNQSQCDAVVAPNGLVCTVYTDVGSSTAYKYAIAEDDTGAVIQSGLITPSSGNVNNSPRVFLLGAYFIIAFGTSTNNIQYISIPWANPSAIAPGVTPITTSYTSSTTVSWDALTVNGGLYFAYNSTAGAGGQNVKVVYLASNLSIPLSPTVFSGEIATIMSLTADYHTAGGPQSPVIYVSYYDATGSTGKTLAIDANLNQVLAPTAMIPSGSIANITSTAYAGVCTIFFEVNNSYSSPLTGASNYLKYRTITQSGTAGTATVLLRSLGLASKAFLIGTTSYMLAAFSSPLQPSYFLIDGSGNIISRLAYSNGGGYLTLGLPNITVTGTLIQIPYLIKDLIASVNKAIGSTSSNVYSQTGINLCSFNLGTTSTCTAEIGGTLNISGGLLWSYDGVVAVEQGFNVWPEPMLGNAAATGGSMADGTYYYQATYEWADNNGNVIRSAPSQVYTSVISGGSGAGSTILKIPTLRLTSKSNVRLVLYRSSIAQPVAYAVMSPAGAPTLNDKTVDSITYTDTLADASIIGNPILYTTGGVVENINGPATDNVTLFDDRLWLIDAEDRNLLWYSKQVIEATSVEMSDLLTMYIAPSQGSQGSTGVMKAIAPMDDKLIIFKKDALGYIAGTGPDNTGANNQYTNFFLINSVIGCSNQQSIVLTPNGLMFQSLKGIWRLNRDLSTEYIGAPVELYTSDNLVLSAINVPDTTQVRFTMDSGITLMYDYFFNQWGTFVNIPAVSSTVYQDLHTYVDKFGQVFQETPGKYLDNSSPVLMSFTTGWINLAGVQGYERLYQALFLGTYITPFKLAVQLAYDYNPSPQQSTPVTPKAPSPNYGGLSLYGGGAYYGGPSNVFEARVFPVIQKCESFQVTVNELYDPSFGIAAGAGLTLSGVNLLVGVKKGTRTSSASRSFG